MATVRKCDICGKIYNHYPQGDEMIAKISTMKLQDGFSTVYSETEMDCCPECTEKLLSFVDILQTYPTRYCIDILNEEE